MKKIFIFLFLTVCMSINAIANKGNTFTTNQKIDFVKRFYVEYLDISTRETCETLRDKIISKSYRPLLNKKELNAGYDFIIRAQDANQESAETVAVTSMGNRWYIVSYLSSYDNKRIEIPVHLTTINGRPQIDNIVTEGEAMPKKTQGETVDKTICGKDISALTKFYKKYLQQFSNDDWADCRHRYMAGDYYSFVQKSSMSENKKNVLVCGVVQASKQASTTVKVSYLKDSNYLVTFVSNGKKYQKKVHLVTSKGKLGIDKISDMK